MSVEFKMSLLLRVKWGFREQFEICTAPLGSLGEVCEAMR